MTSISFPAISTGVYRYPIDRAAQVAVSSAADALTKAAYIREVRFVLFDAASLKQFVEAARAIGNPVM